MKHSSHTRHVLFAAALAIVASIAPASSAEQSVPSCITWSTSARYRGIGYDHLVHIRSQCEQVADCDVSTDVNPEPQRAEVAPGTTAEVVTFIASPSSEFRAQVSCVLRTKS